MKFPQIPSVADCGATTADIEGISVELMDKLRLEGLA